MPSMVSESADYARHNSLYESKKQREPWGKLSTFDLIIYNIYL